MEQKMMMLEIPFSENVTRQRALEKLAECKERERNTKLVSVRIDRNTIKLMTPEKARKYKQQNAIQ